MKRLLLLMLFISVQTFAQYPVPTEVLSNIPAGSLVPFQSKILIFEPFTKSIYTTDGISSKVLLKQLNSSSSYSESRLEGWVENQGILFFKIYEIPTSVSPPKFEFWRTDGTDTGTYILSTSPSYWNASSFAVLNGTVFFVGVDSVYALLNNSQLVGLMSDYTFPNPKIGNLLSYKDYLLYSSTTNQSLNAWNSQTGTFSQLMPVVNAAPGQYDHYYYSLVYNDTLYFYNSIFYNGLWKIAPDLSFSSVDTAFHVQTFLGKVNHKLIFNAVLNTDTFGVGIYTYDLSTGGIERVLSNNGVRVLGQQALSSNDSMAFFVGNDSISGNELWQTDGTSLNTFMDIDYSVGSDGSRFLGEGSSYLCGNFLYLALLPYTGGSGFHVWDGVSLSTTPLKSTSEDPSSFVEFNGDVFFMLNYYSGTRYSLYKFPCALINSADEILSSDFTVYPNPVMNTLKLKSNDNMEGGFVKISNAMGQCLKTSTLPSTDSFIEIDVSGFSSGIYFVEYLDKMNSRRSVMRFVKE